MALDPRESTKSSTELKKKKHSTKKKASAAWLRKGKLIPIPCFHSQTADSSHYQRMPQLAADTCAEAWILNFIAAVLVTVILTT